MDPGTIIVLLVRTTVPFSILRYPLGGFGACLVVDGLHAPVVYLVNQQVFGYTEGVTDYHLLDKFLDLYFLAFAVRASLNWHDDLNAKAMFWMWMYRLVGVTVFSITGLRYVLFFFPNLAVAFFPVILLARRFTPALVPRSGRGYCGFYLS